MTIPVFKGPHPPHPSQARGEPLDGASRLGALLRAARGSRTPAEVAAASGVSLEALRKIESGRVPTPAFFTVAALARALDVPLDELAVGADAATTEAA
jgi:transcriptional regulator with XRE-family HTH domain